MVITLHNRTKMLQRPATPSVLGRLSPWFKRGGRKTTSSSPLSKSNEFGVDPEEDPDAEEVDEETALKSPRKEKDGAEGAKGKEKVLH